MGSRLLRRLIPGARAPWSDLVRTCRPYAARIRRPWQLRFGARLIIPKAGCCRPRRHRSSRRPVLLGADRLPGEHLVDGSGCPARRCGCWIPADCWHRGWHGSGVGAGVDKELTRTDAKGIPEALRRYEDLQRPRVEAAQDNSRLLARLVFRRNRFVATLRDLIMARVSAKVALGEDSQAARRRTGNDGGVYRLRSGCGPRK